MMQENKVKEDSSALGVIKELGELKPASVITEQGLAHLFQRQTCSVKRAIDRGELPPPTKIFGQCAWTVGFLIRHIEKRLAEAAADSEKQREKYGNSGLDLLNMLK